MPKGFTITTASTVALFTTSEAKTHLKVDTTADDTLIDNLIKAARESAEEYTNRYFIDTVITQHGDKWSDLDVLFKSPISRNTSTSVRYYDEDNTIQTLATSVYIQDTIVEPSRITLNVDQSFPNLADRIGAVQCTYTVGYGTTASDVPEAIKQAVLLTIGHWYENRQTVVVGRSVSEIPMAAQYLLDQYKVQTV